MAGSQPEDFWGDLVNWCWRLYSWSSHPRPLRRMPDVWCRSCSGGGEWTALADQDRGGRIALGASNAPLIKACQILAASHAVGSGCRTKERPSRQLRQRFLAKSHESPQTTVCSGCRQVGFVKFACHYCTILWMRSACGRHQPCCAAAQSQFRCCPSCEGPLCMPSSMRWHTRTRTDVAQLGSNQHFCLKGRARRFLVTSEKHLMARLLGIIASVACRERCSSRLLRRCSSHTPHPRCLRCCLLLLRCQPPEKCSMLCHRLTALKLRRQQWRVLNCG